MWHYPILDPVAINLGPLKIHWYAISYLVGIGLFWWVLRTRTRSHPSPAVFTAAELADIIFYGMLGVLLGGRLGSVLFYGWEALVADPWSVLRIWEGGMSFHGGLIGVIVSMVVYARRRAGTRRSFFEITDFLAPAAPLGLGCGRLGNFMNTELPGRVADAGLLPWAVIYPGDTVARHPSSLYQALLEGPLLFAILWLYSRSARPRMAISGLFLLGYGSLRTFSEFYREPDPHMGYQAVLVWAFPPVRFPVEYSPEQLPAQMAGLALSAGQLLSMPMMLIGVLLLAWGYAKNRHHR